MTTLDELVFRDHLTETEGHERAIKARLEARGGSENKLKAVRLLEQAPESAGDPELARVYKEHLEETRGHQRLVEQRLEALGGDPSSLKDSAMRLGALSWGAFFETHPDTPGKLAAFAYAFEHLEITAYEELKRVAQRVEDSDTVRVADEILTQERAAAATLARSFDRAARAALEAVGVS